MSVTVQDFPSVRQRLIELDLHAAGDFLLIPRGFKIASTSQDLLHESSATTVAKLFLQAGLSTGIVQPPSQRLPIIQENDITWVGPTLFIAYSLASSDPAAVTLGLNVLGNYITEFFRGTVGLRRARFDIVLEDSSGACKSIHYDGPPEGLQEVRRTISQLGLGSRE